MPLKSENGNERAPLNSEEREWESGIGCVLIIENWEWKKDV